MSAFENNTRLRFIPMKYVFLQSMTEYYIPYKYTYTHTRMLTWKERAVNDTKILLLYYSIEIQKCPLKIIRVWLCDDKFTVSHFDNVSSRPTLCATCVYLYEFQKC